MNARSHFTLSAWLAALEDCLWTKLRAKYSNADGLPVTTTDEHWVSSFSIPYKEGRLNDDIFLAYNVFYPKVEEIVKTLGGCPKSIEFKASNDELYQATRFMVCINTPGAPTRAEPLDAEIGDVEGLLPITISTTVAGGVSPHDAGSLNESDTPQWVQCGSAYAGEQ